MTQCEHVVQSAGDGATILGALMRTVAGQKFGDARASFSYASRRGAVLLDAALRDSLTRWRDTRKRWLVAFDFGFTEPAAVEFLATLANSEVRIPNAESVLGNRLRPLRTFHAKSLILTGHEGIPSFTCVGSANLTENALSVSHEHATLTLTADSSTPSCSTVLASVAAAAARIDAMFNGSTPLNDKLLRRYEALRATYGGHPPESGGGLDHIPLDPGADPEGSPARLAVMAAARYFWVDVDSVSPNRGHRLPGNQIDLQRGSRVFFGFDGQKVERNHIFGEVTFVSEGRVFDGRGLRYGNNQMDKINLPVPEDVGVDAYAGKTLLFERLGPGRFRMKVVSQKDAAEWRRTSQIQHTAYTMSGGRKFGVFS